MPDDRPANDDLAAVVAEMRRELADLKGTALARAARAPTGDIEPTIRTTAKPDTLLMQGQPVNRADYPALWQWVQDQDLVKPGLFGAGDGSVTFVVPDLRGRTLIGAGTLGPDSMSVGALVGTSRVTLSMAQMPAHDHGRADNHRHWSGDVAPNHQHYYGPHAAGSHGGHIGGAVTRVAGADLAAHPTSVGGGSHAHEGFTSNSGGHDHGYTSNSGTHTHTTQGEGATFDARPPSLAVNWLIWC